MLLTRLEAASHEQSVSPALLASIVAMPECMAQRPRFQGVVRACQKTLLQVYGNAPAVASCDKLLQQFCSLPFAAVLVWAESNELEVHSKNCVVFLLSAWVTKQKQIPSAEHLQQLAHHVRVLHLGAGYQSRVLPSLEWFCECSNMQHLPTLLTFRAWGPDGAYVFPPPGQASIFTGCKVIGAWLKQPRKRIGMGGCMVWDIDATALQTLYKNEMLDSDLEKYMNGYMLGLSFCSTPDPGPYCNALSLVFDVRCTAMHRLGVPWPEEAYVMAGPVTFCVERPTSDTREVLRCPKCPLGMIGGWSDFFGKEGDGSVQESVAPYLKEGQLRVQATFTHIDR